MNWGLTLSSLNLKVTIQSLKKLNLILSPSTKREKRENMDKTKGSSWWDVKANTKTVSASHDQFLLLPLNTPSTEHSILPNNPYSSNNNNIIKSSQPFHFNLPFYLVNFTISKKNTTLSHLWKWNYNKANEWVEQRKMIHTIIVIFNNT